MPHQTSPEEHDPVIASYPVYLTSAHHASALNSSTEVLSNTAQKLLVLQYPAYRPADAPYNARNLQKPTSLRLKPNTGLLEIDIPIDTKVNYNPDKGSEYAKSLKRSRIIQEGGTHGLSGGFNTGPAGRNIREEEDIDMKTIPAHSSLSDDSVLNVQTLGGKIVKHSTCDPIYLLGSFKENAMHLSRLDALVQVRPQLPHLDAADELERNRGVSAFARAKGKDEASQLNGDLSATLPPPAGPSTRPESKAIDIKLKPSGPASHNSDLSTNPNAKLLRAIQQEPWQTYDWIDEDEAESHDHAEQALHLAMPRPRDNVTSKTAPDLNSAITNSEWLDLMSAPRIEHGKKPGDKGLMGKVKGRERERQRRKRNEVARRDRAPTITTTTTTAVPNQASAEENPATGPPAEWRDATVAEDTADDDDDAPIGPSDEESSEDEQAQHHHRHQAGDHDEGEEEADVEMLDPPTASQVDGAAGDDDDVQEVQRPTTTTAPAAAADEPPAPTTPRRRGRPRKSRVPDHPIVLDD